MTVQAQLSGRRVFFYFFAFFLTIAVVDGIMATLAVRTQTGVVTTHAYEKGLAYNDIIQAEEQQETLQWAADIEFKDNALTVELHDVHGNLIHPDQLTAVITRPTQAGMDFQQSLKSGPNAIAFPVPGLWHLRIIAEKDGVQFQQSRRITAE